MISSKNKKRLFEPLTNNYQEKMINGDWDGIKWFFHIYRSNNFKKGDNLISVSYFIKHSADDIYSYQRGKKNKKNYEKEHEEKIKKYEKGIKDIIEESKKLSLNVNVRIYCDITSIHNVEKFLVYDNIELYFYIFPDFFDIKNLCHYGFFGTLIRYFPLFKLDFHNNEEYFTTTIMDIDTNFYNEGLLMNFYINKLKSDKNLPNIIYKNRACYYVSPRVIHMDLDTIYFSVISSFIIQHKPQPFDCFIDFIKNCLIKPCKKFEYLLEKYLPFNLTKRPLGGRLEYGVDEFFMNVFFMKKNYFDKNLPILEIFLSDKSFGVNEWLYELLSASNLKIKNPDLVIKFLFLVVKLFFPKNYKVPKFNDVYELIKIIGNEFYDKKYYTKVYPENKYRKVIDFVEKYGPEELNMPKQILVCLERSIERNPFKTIIRIVKPDPVYPKFKEEFFDEVKKNRLKKI